MEENNNQSTDQSSNVEVRVGTPAKPLSPEVISTLDIHFTMHPYIEEVYQMAMVRDQDVKMLLGFKQDDYTDEHCNDSIEILKNVLRPEDLAYPLEVIFLEHEEWLTTAEKIQNALIYKRKDLTEE